MLVSKVASECFDGDLFISVSSTHIQKALSKEKLCIISVHKGGLELINTPKGGYKGH